MGLIDHIGDGPTLIGTILGSLWISRPVETFVPPPAGSAIFYIVGELLHIGRRQEFHGVVMTGFFFAYGNDKPAGSAWRACRSYLYFVVRAGWDPNQKRPRELPRVAALVLDPTNSSRRSSDRI